MNHMRKLDSNVSYGTLVNKQHTPYHGTAQLFYAGREVGIGFSGTYEGDHVQMYGISNVGRRSVSVHFKARKVAALDLSGIVEAAE